MFTCPHCHYIYDSRDIIELDLKTLDGGLQVTINCYACRQRFLIREFVLREFETEKI